MSDYPKLDGCLPTRRFEGKAHLDFLIASTSCRLREELQGFTEYLLRSDRGLVQCMLGDVVAG